MEVLIQNFSYITWQMLVMWGIGGLLIYLAIARDMEPTLLLPMGFGAILVCAAGGMLLYEFSIFGIGLFLDLTIVQRWSAMAITALLSLIAVPVAYPVLLAIGKIGGETWKE